MSFLDQVCTPFLRRAQDSDGGWGYRPGTASSVEPTCCALLALKSLEDREDFSREAERGSDWLLRAQLPDGSWPSVPGEEHGSWVTALGCLALRVQAAAPERIEKAVRWLTETRPRAMNFFGRVMMRLSAKKLGVTQDPALFGWSWTVGTSSWVEPTAVALLALRDAPETNIGKHIAERKKMGEALLIDRMCPGGGWNCGNPMVYGTPGKPLVGPTAWALLALAGSRECSEVRQSLEWLERNYAGVRGPGSLALSHLCLQVYGRRLPPLEGAMKQAYTANEFFGQVNVMAWATLALGPTPRWLRDSSEAHG